MKPTEPLTNGPGAEPDLRRSQYDNEVNRLAAYLTAHPYQLGAVMQAMARRDGSLLHVMAMFHGATRWLTGAAAAEHNTPQERLAHIAAECAELEVARTRIRDLFLQWLDGDR